MSSPTPAGAAVPAAGPDPRPTTVPDVGPARARPRTASPTWWLIRGFGATTLDLGGGAVRLWLRLFPQLMIIWMIGWLIEQATLRITTQIPLSFVWLALVVFALGFLGTLGAIVLMLRLAAQELDLWQLVPESDADHSVTHILAVTLLPFLGIYAAVDEVAARVDNLRALTLFQTGLLADQTIITEIDPTNGGPAKLAFVIGLIVVAYVLRRVLDLLHEKTGRRALGILVTVCEGYFLLLVIMAGTTVITQAADWIGDRMVVQWIDEAGSAVAGFFAGLGISWPAFVTAAWIALTEVVWPLFRDALAQPVIWLAVAALVFGSKVLSTADLWRQGQPLTAQVPTPDRIRRLQRARAAAATGRGSASGRAVPTRRVWLEFQELFLGDIDDKYLPTVQSLRLILKSGATFLGAYVLLYSVFGLISQGWTWLIGLVVGGHEVTWWAVYGTWFDVVTVGLLEPLRICLLAVAFHRCLGVFRDKAVAVPTHPVARPAVAAAVGRSGGSVDAPTGREVHP